MKILLVEDEVDLAIPISRLFSSVGWDYAVARSVDSVLELLHREVFDICILDLLLGKENGSKVIPILNERNIPVIVLTVIDSVSEKVRCLKMGADDYMVKPFSPEELLARVETVLRRVKGFAKNRVIKYENLEIDPLFYDFTYRWKYSFIT